mgnify:CR=1 FL=1
MTLFDVYSLFDVTPVKAKGTRIWDDKGQEYLDLYGGHAVISVGHCHPKYVAAITDQLNKIGFYSNSVKNPLQVELAGKIGELSGLQDYSLFLINSGAEANENALKLVSFHTGKDRMIAFKGAFHGRPSGAVAVTDNPKYSAPFNSHHKVTFLPLNDIEAVRTELAKGDVAGVIIEGIQGVGGIVIPDDRFMRDLRQATKEAGKIVILDDNFKSIKDAIWYGRTIYHNILKFCKFQLVINAAGSSLTNGPESNRTSSRWQKAWRTVSRSAESSSLLSSRPQREC